MDLKEIAEQELKKKVITLTKKVERFPSIDAIYQKYQPREINPTWKNEQDGRNAWASFPDYTQKIKKFGLIALTL